MPSVQKYFEDAFPSVVSEFSEYDMKELDGMPIDSVCGEACKTAIDQAKALDNLIREGHGIYYYTQAPHTLAIARVAVDLCNLYICG